MAARCNRPQIENIAVGHPKVAEAAVVGVAHPKWGERPLLVVVRLPRRARRDAYTASRARPRPLSRARRSDDSGSRLSTRRRRTSAPPRRRTRCSLSSSPRWLRGGSQTTCASALVMRILSFLPTLTAHGVKHRPHVAMFVTGWVAPRTQMRRRLFTSRKFPTRRRGRSTRRCSGSSTRTP